MNGLEPPARLLKLDGVGAFGVESFDDRRLRSSIDERNIYFPSVAHRVRNRFERLHDVVGPAKIKAHAAVFRFHSCRKRAADPKIVLLNQLYVRPDCQRRGIGQSLLDEIEASFPEARTLRLEVEEANAPAIGFYEANGFRPAGRTVDCGGGSGIPALVLEKRLA